MSVDADTVRRIAHLARIAVAEDEVEHSRASSMPSWPSSSNCPRSTVDGRRADDLGDADGDEEARGRGHRRRHSRRHRQRTRRRREDHFFLVPKVVE